VSNSTGFYPRLQVDTTNSGAVGQAGGVLLTETIAAAGLGPVMSVALSGWRKPLAVHDPAKVVVDLAVTLALGGDYLADIALLRSEPGLYGRVASDATVSRTITALAADRSPGLVAHAGGPVGLRGQRPGPWWARPRFRRLGDDVAVGGRVASSSITSVMGQGECGHLIWPHFGHLSS